MFFIFFNGTARSAAISIALSIFMCLFNSGAHMKWHDVRRIPQEMQMLLLCAVAVASAVAVLCLRRMDLRRWWQRMDLRRWWQELVAEWVPNHLQMPAQQLSTDELDGLVRRLHALPIEMWRPPHLLTARELRRRLDKLGISPLLERQEAVAAIEERSDGVCVVCQEDYCENDALRCLQNCRHEYHLECIDKWVYMEAGKGRMAKCPLCSTPL